MINKLTVKTLIEFDRLSDRSRKTLVNNLTTPKKSSSDEGSGGDYWITGLSALSTAFKQNDNAVVKERIPPLVSKYQAANKNITKGQYKKNLDILIDYQDYDFSLLRPDSEIAFITKSKEPLTIRNIPLQVLPHQVFTYEVDGEPNIGAIWFVAWVKKFAPSDLGIYSESMFKYLTQVYSDHYKVDPSYCLTVDALSMLKASYEEVLNGKIPSLLEPAIDTLNGYL